MTTKPRIEFWTARTVGCSWCVDFGSMLQRMEGMDIDRLQRIDDYAASPRYSADDQRLVRIGQGRAVAAGQAEQESGHPLRAVDDPRTRRAARTPPADPESAAPTPPSRRTGRPTSGRTGIARNPSWLWFCGVASTS